MGFKSKSQNNQQFKVGGLTFPSKNRYNFFRDLDDDINDIVQKSGRSKKLIPLSYFHHVTFELRIFGWVIKN